MSVVHRLRQVSHFLLTWLQVLASLALLGGSAAMVVWLFRLWSHDSWLLREDRTRDLLTRDPGALPGALDQMLEAARREYDTMSAFGHAWTFYLTLVLVPVAINALTLPRSRTAARRETFRALAVAVAGIVMAFASVTWSGSILAHNAARLFPSDADFSLFAPESQETLLFSTQSAAIDWFWIFVGVALLAVVQNGLLFVFSLRAALARKPAESARTSS